MTNVTERTLDRRDSKCAVIGLSRRVGIRRATREDGPVPSPPCVRQGRGAAFGPPNERLAARMYHPDLIRHPDSCPALVLNADYTPLSYYPLSLWPWQTAVKAMFLERVDVVAHYEREVHSPSIALKLPSVIALRQFVRPNEYPAFTRFNLFLRDKFRCVYCGSAQGADLRPCRCRAPRAGGRPGRMSRPPARRAICARAGGRRVEAHMHIDARADPPDQLAAAGSRPSASRPITCTRAGATISTGTSSSSRKQS